MILSKQQYIIYMDIVKIMNILNLVVFFSRKCNGIPFWKWLKILKMDKQINIQPLFKKDKGKAFFQKKRSKLYEYK